MSRQNEDTYMPFDLGTGIDMSLHDPMTAPNDFDAFGDLMAHDFRLDGDMAGLGGGTFQAPLPFDTLPFDTFQPTQEFSQVPQTGTPLAGGTSSQLTTPGSSHSAASHPTDSRPETPSHTVPFPAATSQQVPPKVGTRFSKESLRVLRNWLSSHSHHPFPTDDERQMLERRTGLTKTQILNWLANARRRGKIPEFRTVSPGNQSPSSRPRAIPRRAGTPAPRERIPFMNPLERWVDSPPENEPAEATAIARAVACSSPPLDCDDAGEVNPANTGSGSSQYRPSPVSSVGTSRSSSGSCYSFESRDSATSLGLFTRRERQRRKRRGIKRRNGAKTPLTAPLNTFQCTFCTETFSTKHTWQRHEKSLHLALERWICAPSGPRTTNPDGTRTCVFCHEANPDDGHIDRHNYAVCQERQLEERTFHRKDHLGQHLRLVHNLKPEQLGQQLSLWKMETPEIKSRCGFCGIVMDTWAARTDHLAEHFKTGCTMSDWNGDWGFEPSVVARLENAMAPYLIPQERTSPFPFTARHSLLESPRNAYELITLELVNYVDLYYDQTGRVPSSREIQFDACRIIFAAEVPAYRGAECGSWLRDLILSADDIVQRAKLSPLRSAIESRLTFLTIIGQDNPFEGCPLEARLVEYVKGRPGQVLTDRELQHEACRIIQNMETDSASPADIPATWLLELARASTAWLRAFRQRVGLPRAETAPAAPDPSMIDLILHNYNELERKLTEHVEILRGHGIEPDDTNLRQHAMRVISEFDNAEWREAAANNHAWLARFKRRHLPWSTSYTPPETPAQQDGNHPPTVGSLNQASRTDALLSCSGSRDPGRPPPSAINKAPESRDGPPPVRKAKKGFYFLNDPNFDRWVAKELARWVAATMSPHNPNQHVPTDEELQHQARWIIYEDGDPFNMTDADNAEWLRRFKRDVGILKDVGPGLDVYGV